LIVGTPMSVSHPRVLLLAIGAAAGLSCGRAQDLPPAADILTAMRRVNDHFMREWPDPGQDIVTNQRRPSNIWTRAVYYEGLLALHAVDGDPREQAYALAWAAAHHWGLRGGAADPSADDQCCGQVYLELYEADPQAERIRSIQASVDAVAASGRVADWWWIDALQMAMPVYAQLGVITHEPRYFERMHALFLATRDGTGTRPGLYNPRDGLWWRDHTFVPPYRDPNGADCYWSRGNGWVMAAMARILEVIPADAAGREDYVRMLRAMAPAITAVQRPDGFWNPSLHDADHYAAKEVSGTALFTFALGCGIRLGLLAPGEYRPVVARAWTAMVRDAVHPDGFLGYVQGTGKQPSDSQPITYDRRPDFDDFGTGCFLLAGSEAVRLAGAPASP